ncbi:MAG: PKD domain-containing protein, partial [Bacteroidetes bacterium]|nr:PKD domain-containing protein [Bacteroidota bacterium]
FGAQMLTGTYTVIATGVNGCTSNMNGSIVVNPLPIAFDVLPTGINCTNTVIGLNGSQLGVNYILVLNGVLLIDTIPGTGSPINFGLQVTPGTYTVNAYNTTTGCQSTMNGNSVIKVSPLAYAMTPNGSSCVGVTIGLVNSEIGVNYQLRLNGTINIGAPVVGTGIAISFGAQSLPGTYTVVATSGNGCSNNMTGSVVVNPLPVAFTIAPAGANCMGASLGVNGSELNVNYILVLNNSIHVDTIPGTGSSVTFGPQFTTGSYTVIAYNTLTMCTATMFGTSTIQQAPTVYNLTPVGIDCVGATIGIDNSDIGVTYQLRRNGTLNIGAPLAGTGSALSFGPQLLPGTYTVEASNGNNCISVMNGTITLYPLPLAFSIVPTGNHCPGTIITLNGSELGMNYVLMRNSLFPVDTLPGTGATLNFGAPLISGTYTILAYSTVASCQSTMIGNCVIMLAPTAYNVTPAGISCVGATIGLDNSEVGVNYQLWRNGTVSIGAPIAGTGSAISFGVINITGTYTVTGISTLNGCPTTMNGSANLQPAPLAYTLVPQGIQCAGTSISLNGSAVGYNYVLVIDGTFYADTLAGTGSALNFGPQFITGNYTILAIGGSSSCQVSMVGSCDLMAMPTAFNVIPAGMICASAIVGLDGSELGTDYTLYKDGISTGITLPGTGSPLTFGLQIAGVYTIKAMNLASGCSVFMTGNATIDHLPTVNAGADISTCSDLTVPLNGTASFAGTTTWVTLGTGTFNNPSILNAVYTFGAADITNGSVLLVLNVAGSGACASSINSDTLLINITPAPVVNAGPDIEVCQNGDYTVSGATASNYTTMLWSTSGTGNFLNSTSLVTTYVPSAADLAAGSVNLTLTIHGIAPCMNVISDVTVMTFHPFLTASAGPNDTICAGSSYTFSGATATNYASVIWSTLGSGSFVSGNSLTATYTPSMADVAAGSVTLVMKAFPIAPCTATISDSMILYITPTVLVNAGADINICEGSIVTTLDATAANYSSLLWTTSGSGAFSSTNILHPVYTPSLADVISGSVTLTLTANGNTPCPSVSDQKVVSITRQPQIYAGPDTLLCEGNVMNVVAATASFFTNLNWTSSGTGSFTNGNTVSPTYSPSVADIAAGSVILTMSVDALAPCTGTITDSFILNINKAPAVNAGPDASICENTTYILSGASASNFATVSWTTSGTGIFSNSSVVNPVYIPSTADILSGSVTLTLTANALPSCTTILDQMVLSITQLPQVNAGTGTHICTNPYTLTGATSSNVASILWTVTTGTGTLANANTLTPTFTPSALDITNGFAVLTLTGNPLNPCPAPATDTIILTIDQTPVVYAGADACNCMSATYTVNDATAIHYASLIWTSTGTGTLINATTLTPSYTPSAADLVAGSVILTLTASNSGCGVVSDSKKLTFISMPVVNAGPDMVICQNTSVTIGGASASSYSTLVWTTSGTGTFANANTVSPTYTPSAADILSGTVTLTLTGNAISPCTGSVIDQAILTIKRIPVINAGIDDKVCSTDVYLINDATAVDYDSLVWTTSGTGIFTNPNAVLTSYIPSASDIANGSVILTLTASNPPCSDVTDSKVLTIIQAPLANAGPDATICNICNYDVIGATAPNSTTVQWTTFGSGTFSNAGILNPTYYPSAFDYAQGHVVLQLSVNGNAPCTAVTDTMTLFFSASPGVDFTWGPTCEGQPVPFSVNTTATNVGAVANWNWNFGDGTTSTVMNPSHFYANVGYYTVTLTITDTTGNLRTNIHQIYVSQLPVAFFTADPHSCSNEPVHFTDLSHTLLGNIAQWVWSYGDGTPNDTIIFPNDPNTIHLYDTAGNFNVILIVTNSFGCIASVTQAVQIIAAPVANFTYTSSCNGLNTNFHDASNANGTGNVVQWWWDFGDPATGVNNYSDQQDPMHLFSAPGTYQVTHVARNFNNCTDTIVKSVVILPGLAVDFTHQHTCVNDLSYFAPDPSVMNVSSITSWAWDFGDGGYSYIQSPVHMYLAPGSYQVTLTVTDLNGCTSFKKKTIVVNPLPVAQFNISAQHCKGIPVDFNDVSNIYAGYIVNWTWDFGDGSQQSYNFPANPDTDHTYTTSGTYTVTLTITASDSCTAIATQMLVIDPAPTVNFEALNTCQNNPVQFNDLSQLGGTGTISGWEWNFGDPITGWNNTSNLQNPQHTYANSGNYQVSLTVHTINGCSNTLIKTISITPKPVADFYTDAHCANSPVQFHPTPNVNAASVTNWFWDFGDGLTGNISNPVHIYTTAGNYQVTLTITDISGCQSTMMHTVHVIAQPSVIFGHSQPTCAQSAITFTSGASAPEGNIVRWEWNFGDGNNQTVYFPANPTVTHQYANYGNFNITLTVYTNDSCSNFQTQSINILQSPTANFQSSGTCAAQNVLFTDQSQGNVSNWSWNFGDPLSGTSNTSSVQNPQHTYSQAGTYQVTLIAGSVNGCFNTITKAVTITPAPAVNFSYNNGCANDTIMFVSSGYVVAATTASWFWQFGDNTTSTSPNPGHIYATPGTYTVTLTITNLTGCSNTKVHQVQVSTAPIAQFSYSAPSCSNSSIQFNDISSASNGTITSWHWDFGDGNTTNVNAPSNPDVAYTYASSGIYTVVLTIHTSSGCENHMATNIVVNASPVAAYSFNETCFGQPTSFTDLSQAAGNAVIGSWSWNFGDPTSGNNNTTTVASPFHLFTASGAYTVTLVVTNTTGCSDTISQTVTVTPPPTVEFLSSQPSCDGTPVTFKVDPSVVAPTSVAAYDWDFGDGSIHSNMASPSHLYPSAGNYNVNLTITNTSGCDGSISHTITVHNLPVAQFAANSACSNNLTLFDDNSYSPDGSAIIGWHWDFGVTAASNDTSNLQNPSFAYPAAGNYNVSLTVTTSSGCNSTTIVQVHVIPAPNAMYQYTAEPCHNGSVIFQDQSTSPQSAITGWYWEFTPGTYSTLRDPVHVFGFTDTTFSVKLIVTNATGCTDTIIKQVYIPAGMDITLKNTQTCLGETTWFTSNVLNPVGDSLISFTWNFGEPESGFNNISHLRNPSHTYSKSGPFVVSLEATDIHNCTKSIFKSIEIASLPVAAYSYIGGQCDSLITFADHTSGASIDQWIWQFGDGSSDTITSPSSPNVNHYYTYPGIYMVSLTTISKGGCTNMITDTVRRTPCISSSFDYNDTLICQKKTMHFVDHSYCQAPIASWTWDFGDNTVNTFTSGSQVVEHTYMAPGTYTVKLTISTQMVGGAVTASSTGPVSVNPAPSSNFTWKDVCIGGTTPFTNSTNGNGTQIKDYMWKFGDPANSAATSTLRNPTYQYANPGNFDVHLVSSNTIGCYDTIAKSVTIFAPPAADFKWSNSCEGKPVYFIDQTDTSSSTQITTWNWYFSDQNQTLGASTSPNPSYYFTHAGIFDTKMIVVDRNGCSDTTSQQVAINASPVAVFNITDNYEDVQGKVKLNNGTVNGSNYFWDFGNGKTSYEDEPVVTFDQDGDYTVKLIASNGQNCSDTTTLNYSLLFKGLYVPNAFAPDDTHSGVTLFKPSGLSIAKYNMEVVDRWGNVMWSSDKLDVRGCPTEGWDGTLNNNPLPQGVYLWRAKAVFRDGTYWDGHNVGKNENMPQTFTGTVTLIR